MKMTLRKALFTLSISACTLAQAGVKDYKLTIMGGAFTLGAVASGFYAWSQAEAQNTLLRTHYKNEIKQLNDRKKTLEEDPIQYSGLSSGPVFPVIDWQKFYDKIPDAKHKQKLTDYLKSQESSTMTTLFTSSIAIGLLIVAGLTELNN
jgi:hypothetical protein